MRLVGCEGGTQARFLVLAGISWRQGFSVGIYWLLECRTPSVQFLSVNLFFFIFILCRAQWCKPFF
jgi:hypothetical protein